MTTATVTVKFVNQPKQGKKMGSIRTQELGFINVWPDKLSNFVAGQKYTIDYADEGGFKKLVKVSEKEATAEPPWEPPGDTQPHVDPTPERIYVCGIVNAFVSTGKFEPTALNLAALTSAARQAWAQTFGK